MALVNVPHLARFILHFKNMSFCSFTRFSVIANCGFKSKGYTVHTFDTTVCNNAKPGKRIVRHFNAIAKCGTSSRATNCVNAIYGIKSMDYSLYFLYHMLICGIKSMDYSLYFVHHILC